MKQRIILDFDGTIVDTRVRQHHLFCELSGVRSIGLSTFWRDKRSGLSTGSILQSKVHFDAAEIARFRRGWLAAIEDPSLLEMDTLIPGSLDALEKLSSSYNCVVISGRQSLDRLICQIDELGIGGFFEGVVVTAGKYSKDEVARQAGFALSLSLIGDSVDDICAARRLDTSSIGVLSGASSVDILSECMPDFIIPSISELYGLLSDIEGYLG